MTGTKGMVGEYLQKAQGEDVVAGIRTPEPLSVLSKDHFENLSDICDSLESINCDMQDIEFTIESDTLYLLQTRNGKRSSKAAIQIAYDMWKEGTLSKKSLKSRIAMKDYFNLMEQKVDPSFDEPPCLFRYPCFGSHSFWGCGV